VKLLGHFISIFAVAAVSITFAACKEVEERSFENLGSAQKEHMTDKGWIPIFTPADATQIHFAGDLDAGTVYGRFVSSNREAILHSCSAAEGAIHFPVQNPSLFPPDLEHASTAEELKYKGYDVLKCDADSIVMAVQASSNQVFYWSERKVNRH
jgi:hypothetical protein